MERGMNQMVSIIDDSLTIRKILEVCLHRAGYQTTTFSDAIEVFDWLRTPEAKIPALVFVDVGLPRMDGYTLMQRLRARPAFAQTTFVVISSHCGVLAHLKARLAGATVALTKPLRTQTILSVAQQYLGPPLGKDNHTQPAQSTEQAVSGGYR